MANNENRTAKVRDDCESEAALIGVGVEIVFESEKGLRVALDRASSIGLVIRSVYLDCFTLVNRALTLQSNRISTIEPKNNSNTKSNIYGQ